ncbi:uncharacterized protein PFLUO_LOCUS5479 [Penicillium psychrofluorescens]|uniref:uncharacterized protein n=1 Tax=Penicillium psychrofluorescens TaxID=3158075 RepID=UPI003CCD6A0B
MITGYGYDYLSILNIQLDGLRPTLGLVEDGGANIDIGQSSNGIIVSNIVSKNTRGWSCLHLIQSGSSTPCTNVTISNNNIGPCGNEGLSSTGVSQWADGISFACENSLIENNLVNGSTDGGVVLFGAPQTTVKDNTIISSTTDSGFGGINMVDYLYDGSYDGVVVTGNTITGKKMFNVGIAIGAYAWSFNDDALLQGPATISDNTLNGNLPFAIAINGWTGGLTISGNDVSGVNSPSSGYSDSSSCSAATKALWSESAHLSYYPAGLIGTNSLQSGFVAASANSTNFICTTPLLPASITYGLNGLSVGVNNVLANLHNNIYTSYQGDSNIVVYNSSTGTAVVEWASGHTDSACSTTSTCTCDFQGDGNFVTYADGAALWSSGTTNEGHNVTFLNESPWIEITNAAGAVIWTTADS